MRKVILILLVLISAKVSAQVYQEMPQYGYRANRMAFDSTLQIPTVCGVPTLKSIVKTNKSGAIAYDSCNARFYAYNPSNQTWTAITGGGGGSTDTTSLSNRINLKIDSLKRSNDSVYAYRNGTRVFQFKDSVGGGGNFWKTSGTTDLSDNVLIRTDSIIQFNGIDNETKRFQVNANSIVFNTPEHDFRILDLITTTDTSTYKPLGIASDGKLAPLTSWVSGGVGVAVDTIFRTLGKDSIFYKKNNITYAIKDSVGTNPAPVGYYGAFQDTTTQTAVSINTAYAVKLGVTDLSNGVTISNNTRIKIANAGIYNIQFSLQLEKTGGSGNMIADIWLRKNGVNLQGTTGKVVLTGSANASPVVAAWNYVIAVSSNDSLELMWATSNDNVVIKATLATSPHPSIPSAILTVTQQSGIMAGTGISPLDTANMLSNYARTNLVNTKLNISDTSTLQPKSISSYSILANNTNATANATAQIFKQFGNQTYSDSITFTGVSTPSGATNHSYRWSQIGNLVTLHITLTYATTGSLSQVAIEIPDGLPAPILPTGLTANNDIICYGSGYMVTNTTSVAPVFSKVFLRQNTGLINDYEVVINQGVNASFRIFNATIQYFAQ
jgi:hypothetical protein